MTQKFTILLLHANYNKSIRGKLWFQKILFLISQNIEELKEDADFEEDLMGPYSETAAEEFEQLILDRFIHKRFPNDLTSLGKTIARNLEEKISNEEIEIIIDMKKFLNDLTEDELLGFIYFSYSEYTEESIKFHKIKKNRLNIAISLFRKNKISLGKASLISGLDQEELIKLLKQKGIKIYVE